MPFFSVIIPTYNRASLLPVALAAVFAQRYQNFELIVVDDGSTDDTKTYLQKVADNRIKYVYQHNAGVCAARNTGARHAVGEWLVFLDSDDTVSENWLSDFFAEIIGKHVDVVLCNRIIPGHASQAKPYSGFLAGTFSINRQVFMSVGMYDTNIKYGENTELRWRIDAAGYKTVFIDRPNVIYNVSSVGGGANRKNRVQFFYYVIEKHAKKFLTEKGKAQTLCQVAGVDSFHLGNKSEARDLLWKGYCIKPGNLKALLRAVWYSVRF